MKKEPREGGEAVAERAAERRAEALLLDHAELPYAAGQARREPAQERAPHLHAVVVHRAQPR